MSKKLADAKTALVESSEKWTDVAAESKECHSKRKREQASSEKSVEKIKENVREVTRVHEVRKAELRKDVKDVKSFEISIETPQVASVRETPKAKSTKDDHQPVVPSEVFEEIAPVLEDTKSTEEASKTKKIPVIEQVVSFFFF